MITSTRSSIWTPAVEVLIVQPEKGIFMQRDKDCDHVPHSISNVTWHFINYGGHINCLRKFGHGLELSIKLKNCQDTQAKQ